MLSTIRRSIQWEKHTKPYEDQIKEISEEIADSDNQLFINIQSSQLANIYSSLTDIYKKEGNVSKVNELSEKLFELNKKNAGDNEEAILEAEIGRQEYLFHQRITNWQPAV